MGKRLPEIKQREDGRYEIKVTVSRNKRRSVYGKTEAEVRKKARQLLEEATKFNLSNISKMTVRTYMTNWLLTVKKPDLKPGSYDRVEQSVNYQILPYIGDIQISALNANDIQNMINELLGKLSYSTVKKAYNIPLNASSTERSHFAMGMIVFSAASMYPSNFASLAQFSIFLWEMTISSSSEFIFFFSL